MRHLLCNVAVVLACLASSLDLLAITETEPNNNFVTADETFADSTFNGSVSPLDDDYMFTVAPDDGTFQVIVSYTNTSGSSGSDLYFYAYNRNRSQIASPSYINVALGSTFIDTFYLYCMAKDTVFFRNTANGAFDYTLEYNLLPAIANDVEPNNVFADAQEIFEGISETGRISYSSGVLSDPDDYFFTVLPDDGTVQFVFDWINTSGSAGSDIWFYGYNRIKTQLTSILQANQPIGVQVFDTLYIPCQAADTFFFRITSSGCFNYNFKYDLLPAAANDVEPNATRPTAQEVFDGVTQAGRVGHSNGLATDSDDYFFTVLPDDGTVQFTFDWTNTSGSTGSDIWFYAYNRIGTQVGSILQANQPINVQTLDTLIIPCQAADTFYFRVTSAGCFNYNIKYNLLPAAANDVEPNATRPTAQEVFDGVTQAGRVGHSNGLATDSDDYFFTVLPDDGTVQFTFDWTNTSLDGGSDIWFYGYNRIGSQVTSILQANQPINTQFFDTLNVYCQAADTFYFRVTSAGCFEYNIKYNLLPAGPDDVDGNNNFTNASQMTEGISQPGRISHNNGLSTDTDDYFYTVLAEDGIIKLMFEWDNTSNSTGSDLYLYGYNRNKTQTLLRPFTNQPITTTRFDTSYIYCQKADTVYFRVYATGCFDYRLKYELQSPTVSDAEPNNTIATAIPLAVGEGTVGFGNGISNDNDDYYRIVNPKFGNVSIDYTISNNTNSGGPDFYLRLYKSNGAQVGLNQHLNVTAGTTIRDTLLVTCQAADTFYARFNSNACFNYTINGVQVTDEQPTLTAKYTQLADAVAFIADTGNATDITWDFGDGNSSNLAYPSKTYPIGGYTVIASASKAGCNLNVTDTVLVEVKGIEMYEPKDAGVGGDVPFHVYGGGLSANTNVVIKRGADSYTLQQKSSTALNNHLAGFFDLHFAEPGLYDVEITIPGEPTVTFPNGLDVKDFEYPYCTAEIVGPDLARRNRNGRYVLKVSNNGNVMARSAIVHIVYPASANVDFGDQIMKRDLTGTTTITEDTSTYTLPNSDFDYWTDTAEAFVAIDTFAGEPYDGYFGRFYIPFVPAQSSIEIPFTASFGSNGEYEMIAYMNYPNREGSSVTPQLDNFDNVYLSNTIDALDLVADNTKNVPLEVLVKATKVGQKHLNLTARIGLDWMFSKYYGYEISDQQMQSYIKATGEANEFLAKTALEEGAGYVSGLSAKQLRQLNKIETDNLFKILARNKKLSPEAQQKVLEGIRNLNDGSDRIASLDKLLNTTRGLKTLDEKRRFIEDYLDQCPDLKDQLEDLLDLNDEELNHKKERKKRQRVINSTDPNAIYGISGSGAQQSIFGDEMLHYMVTFENVDTASAAAQIVIIHDTIDPNIFDLSTFEFGSAYIADRPGVNLGNNRKQIYLDVDMNPTINLIVRIYAKVDTLTGVIEWRFVSLDPNTMDLPLLEGFLPPNVTSPEGEGAVTYSVKLRDNVANGTVVPNVASIIFDDNEAIRTNTWENLVDKVPPTSSLSVSKVDTTISFNLTGTDAESGLEYWQVFFKTDTSVWASLITTDEANFQMSCDPNVTYYFYVEATDTAGNRERKPEAAEATIVGIDEQAILDADIILYPNPASGEVFIRTDRTLAGFEIEIVDLLGSVQYQSKDQTALSDRLTAIDVSHLSQGVYLVNLRSGVNTVTKKLMIAK